MKPPAIRQFILKVHSRCDLACNHCYVYEHEDQSWREQPLAISSATVALAADRIAQHAEEQGLAEVFVVLHGGEPLLLGPARLARTLETLRDRIDPVTRLDLRVVTNAVRLTEEFCEVFGRYDTKVGVSLDGTREANDRHRVFADGRSSHALVLKALRLLRRPEYRRLYAGILCTVDTANDPREVYEALIAEQPPRLDFLLPHATWEKPPVRSTGTATEYADWLLAVHECWTRDGCAIPIRFFDSLEATLRGEPSLTESLGAVPADLIVIETDGAYEQADSLKTAFHGAPATGFHIARHSISEAAAHPGIVARQGGIDGLCATCRACPVVHQCGGGLYAHRYSVEGSGFDNPSVYCADLKTLIDSLRSRRAPADIDRVAVYSADASMLVEALDEAASIGFLARAETAMNRDVMLSLMRAASPWPAEIRSAWEILSALDEDVPDAVDRVLAHPFVRVWLLQNFDEKGRARSADLDLAPIGAIALSAAVRTRTEADGLSVTPREDGIYLPGLGTIVLPDAAAGVTITPKTWGIQVAVGAERFEIELTRDGAANPEAWRPIRTLAAPGIKVLLEDADPFRNCHDCPVTDRIPDHEYAGWQRSFVGAISFLDDHLPRYAAGLRAGLQCVVPLERNPAGRLRSGTVRDAPGSVGIAGPGTAATLALLLIHEFQHVKLGALMDLVELYDPLDERLFAVPWREDPRPLEAALQGAYAHVAVSAYWGAVARSSSGSRAAEARGEWLRARSGALAVFEDLIASGSLTRSGRRLIEFEFENLADH